MNSEFLETLWVTFKLAFSTTTILVLIGLPLAYFLAYSKFKLKPLIEALVSMPLVLPPTVLGYYFLVAYSPKYWFGHWLGETFGIKLAFSFTGVLIASVLFGLPFMVQPLQNGLRGLPENLREAAYTLGKSRSTTFFKVLLPNIKTSVITAIALTFAHCIGEFGIVIMVGGSMPGNTKVASIAIYDEVQAMNLGTANKYAFVLFVISFLMLTVIYSTNKRHDTWKIV
jgi:molybdate transport system permease protein